VSGNQFQASHTPFGLEKYEAPYEVGRVKVLKELFPLGNGRKALDVGCGPGYFSRELFQRGWRTTVIDSDRENIAAASEYAEKALLGDATMILSKLPDRGYDLILCLELLEHMPKERGKELLVSIEKALGPHGKLILSTPNRLSPEGLGYYYWGQKIRGWGKWDAWDPTHIHIYSSLELIRLLKTVGFTVERTIGYHYEGLLPLVGRWRLPLVTSATFPLNLLGFDVIIESRRRIEERP